MERPLSTGSSTTTAPSTTSGPTHKRNASIKGGGKSTIPSVVSLFVTNLRLLNLDLLPDWPNITVYSFSNQDARMRIKCTEYALYQLFRLYDRATSAEKLQPFFPPLEPLQSVNLRAALFRCLNELKKNGVLSKDTVLRKSMLDDCQGDKLWEVCLNFSVIVLRKVSLETGAKYFKPIAERIGTTRKLDTSQRESLLPLAVAHRAALSKVLDEKRRKRETYVKLHDLLSEKGEELKQRKVKSQAKAKGTKAFQPDRLRAVEKAVEKSWVGSTELKDALINGDTCAKGDGLLVESFDQLWQQDNDVSSILSNGAEVGLLQDLSSKATQQSVRLSMWQNYLDRIVAEKPSHARTSHLQVGTQRLAIRFDRHRGLNLKNAQSGKDDTPHQTPAKHGSASRYEEILTAMREELRKNTAFRKPSETQKRPIQLLTRAHTQPNSPRNPSLDLDASPGAKDFHSRSPSQTAVPVGPRVGRRTPSQPKSYEKPKVDGQREPIPLKSELFSPLKENRRRNASLPSPASISSSPAGDVKFRDVSNDDVVNSAAVETEETILIGGNYSGDQGTSTVNGHSPNSARNSASPDEGVVDVKTTGAEFKIPPLPGKKQRDESSITRPSLTERTRMSIAFNSSEDVSGFLPAVPAVDAAHAGDTHDALPIATTPPSVDRRTTLLERTRESVLMAPAPEHASRSTKSSHTRARSFIHPINQFDTPQKVRSSIIDRNNAAKRDVTPIDQLLSPDTEYESVFKARPRIALSPKLTPYQDTELPGNGSLENDVGTSSPSIDVVRRTIS